MSDTILHACRLALVRPDLDPEKREGKDLFARFTFSLVLAAMALTPVMLIGPRSPWTILLLLMLVPLALAVGYFWRRKQLDRSAVRDRVGYAVLATSGVTLEMDGSERLLPFERATVIAIKTREYQGKPIWSEYRPHHSGIASVQLIDERGIPPFQVLLRTKRDQQHLLDVMKTWYRAGLTVRESVYDINTFLMRSDRSYEELQAAKKEYGLTDLWPSSRAK